MLRSVRSMIAVVTFSSLLYGQDSATTLLGLRELIAKGVDPRMSRVFLKPQSFDGQLPARRVLERTVVASREIQWKGGKALVTSNIPLHPNPFTSQSELSVALHPMNSAMIFVGANTLHLNGILRSQGWYYSNDSGRQWGGGDTIPTHTNFNLFMADPSVAIGLDSTLFFNSIRYNGTDTGDVVVAKSTDRGTTWTEVVIPNNNIGEDKNYLTIDNNPMSPFHDYLYTAFTDFVDEEYTSPVKFSRSTDYGESFSSPVVISDYIGLLFAQGVNLATGPNGELYAAWSGYDNWPPPVQTKLGFNVSTNGGATWQGARIVRTVNDVRGMLRKGNDSIRVSSFPSMAVDNSPGPRNGWLYIVYAERSPQRPDIYLIRSSDGGRTWSSPQRIVNGRGDRWSPWITVDRQTGALYVIYYDSRNFPANDSAEVYLSASFDGGFTFQDFKVSDEAFLPKPIASAARGYMGDYIGVSAFDNVVWCAWNDDRNGIHQAYAATLTFKLHTQPVISVDPAALDFGPVILNTTKTLSLAISNEGIAETLWISSVESDNKNFVPLRTTMAIPARTTSQLDIEFHATALGEIEALLTIACNDPERPAVVVPMRATTVLPPTIDVAPDSLALTIPSYDSGTVYFTITNFGPGPLLYSLSSRYRQEQQGWLRLEQSGGTLLYGDSVTIKTTMLSGNLMEQTYLADIIITSNDSTQPEILLPVCMTVEGIPRIVMNTNLIGFSGTFVGISKAISRTIRNQGTDSLLIDMFINGDTVFTMQDNSQRLVLPQDTVNITLYFTPDSARIYEGMLTIVHNDPEQDTLHIQLTGLGMYPPRISVFPDSFQVYAGGNHADSVELTIRNSGLTSLQYSIIDSMIPPPYLPLSVYQSVLPLAYIEPDSDASLVDIRSIHSLTWDDTLWLQIFTRTRIDHFFGFIALDVDQDIQTGAYPPYRGTEKQNVGADYYISFYNGLFQAALETYNFHLVQYLPFNYDTNKITIALPLHALGNDDGQVNISAAIGYYYGQLEEWVPDSGHITLLGKWIGINSDDLSGIVLPNTEKNIPLFFMPGPLYEGEYNGSIIINSNDPFRSTMEVPVALTVIGTPQIKVTPLSLNFGDQYVGHADTLRLGVINYGNDTLVISNFEFGNSNFSIPDDLPFQIIPYHGQLIRVVCLPLDTGNIGTTLSIYCNIGGDSITTVEMLGRGIYPPLINVQPDSFVFSFVGTDSVDTVMTITNNGLGSLRYTISQKYFPPMFGSPEGNIERKQKKRLLLNDTQAVTNNSITLNDNSTMKILVLEIYAPTHAMLDSLHLPYSIINLRDWENPVAIDFQKYDLIIIGSAPMGDYLWDFVERKDDIESFLFQGGSIIAFTEWGDFTPRIPWAWLPDSVSAIYAYGNTVRIIDSTHPIMESLSSADLSNWWYSYGNVFAAYPPTYSILATRPDLLNLPVVLTGEYGAGRVVLTGLACDYAYWGGQRSALTLLGNMIRWAYTGRKFWLAVQDTAGELAPGEQTVVRVGVASRALPSGTYPAEIFIESNDPVSPALIQTVSMRVQSYPIIITSPDTMHYHETLIGDTSSLELLIHNKGGDTLLVHSMTLNNSEFAVVTDGELKIQPSKYEKVQIQYIPSTIGRTDGILTITSNASDDSVKQIFLQGEGIYPPEISVSTDTINAVLYEGSDGHHQLPVSNIGHSPLCISVTGRYVRQVAYTEVDTSMRVLAYGDAGGALCNLYAIDFQTIDYQQFDTVNFSGYDLLLISSGDYYSLKRRKEDIKLLLEQGKGVCVISNWLLYEQDWLPDTIRNFYYRGNTFLVRERYHPIFDSLLLENVDHGMGIYYKVFTSMPEEYEVQLEAENLFSAPILITGKFAKGNIALAGFEYQGEDEYDGDLKRIYENLIYWSYGLVQSNPSADTLSAGTSSDIELIFNTENRNPGSYKAYYAILSNDPQRRRVTIPVNITILPAPNIKIGVDTFHVGDLFVGYSDTVTLPIKNVGSEILRVESISCDSTLGVVYDSLPMTIYPHQEARIKMQIVSFAEGDIRGTVKIRSNDPDDSLVVIPVYGRAGYPPSISVSQDSILLTVDQDDSVETSLRIYNGGRGMLIFQTDVRFSMGNYKWCQQTAGGVSQIIPLRIEDMQGIYDTLWFGVHPDATYGIDTFLNEYELPPVPPVGSFDTRLLDIPSRYPEKGNGVKTDIRRFVRPTQVDTFLVRFQAASGGYPVKLSWSPEIQSYARAMQLVDRFGGAIVNIDMFTTTSVSISNYDISQLFIFKSGAYDLSIPWLFVVPDSGMLEPDSSMNLLLSVRSQGLLDSTYFGSVIITSNDPEHPTVTIPVKVDVMTNVSGPVRGLPKEFALYQNFPNPFNPITELRFDIPTASRVTVEIYNILGQKVTTLIDDQLPPGRHDAKWKAEQYPTGVYFYRISAVDTDGKVLFTDTKKLLLVK